MVRTGELSESFKHIPVSVGDIDAGTAIQAGITTASVHLMVLTEGAVKVLGTGAVHSAPIGNACAAILTGPTVAGHRTAVSRHLGTATRPNARPGGSRRTEAVSVGGRDGRVGDTSRLR